MKFQHNSFDDFTLWANNSQTIVESFSEWSWTKTISVGAEAKLTYLILMREQCELDLRIESAGEGAEILVKGLLLAKAASKIQLKAHAHLMHNHATADLHLVSFLQDGSVCEVDGGVDLHKDVAKVSWHLLEENVILWKNIQIKTLPMLDVRSSDVSASHGARIQKIDEKKLFYMMSKGLSKQQAEELMIKGYFGQMFDVMRSSEWEMDEKLDELEKESLEYLLA